MVDTEFWYAEEGNKADGRDRSAVSMPSKKWWLPSPRVPESGLSASQRKRLGFQGKLVHQVLKAAKSINEQVLLQMPIPVSVKDALRKVSKNLSQSLHFMMTNQDWRFPVLHELMHCLFAVSKGKLGRRSLPCNNSRIRLR